MALNGNDQRYGNKTNVGPRFHHSNTYENQNGNPTIASAAGINGNGAINDGQYRPRNNYQNRNVNGYNPRNNLNGNAAGSAGPQNAYNNPAIPNGYQGELKQFHSSSSLFSLHSSLSRL